MGFLVSAILVANNIRDLETDRTAGKRTLAVILGRPKTKQLYAGLIYGAFIAITSFGTLRLVPLATLIAVFWLPWGVGLVRTVYSETSGAALIGALKGTARLQLLVAFSLALGASA